ncbi:MAG: efflux transporter periplasmic adaptor subunit [Gimesia sp.]|jgi:RND family efflux transporter MFP subunit|uniref:efflux RND transporter periplasmic adaptor subunit n=1 Tax=Gimesia maris TaxID=122 RepID=UPI000C0B96D8|nr:efflux transporter periplasmic adaptor subunit [Gimesia sp.]|tara:strand:+ start:9478 stop:10887 length:1410 start_codon:yes stop_codon:yes gene_type:complete
MSRVTLFVLLIQTLTLTACNENAAPPVAPPPAKVTTARPLVLPVIEWDEYTGRLAAIDAVEVRARVSGYLQSTHFEEGQLIEKGDLLAIIDPRPFVAELNAAQARLEEANARLAESRSLLKQSQAERADAAALLTLADQRVSRVQQLARKNATTQDDVDVSKSEKLQAEANLAAADAMIESSNARIKTSEAAIETAKANLEAAELNIQYTQIRAPISGRISRRYVTEGNLISGGSEQSTLLTNIVSVNPIHCYFDADEQAFLKYARLSREGTRKSSRDVKNPVYMRLIDEKGFPHIGHMDFVDNRIDPNTGTMRGRAIFSNDDDRLTPGLFAEVRLPGSGRQNSILIPDSAIGSDQSEKYVYLVDTEKQIRRQAVELGPIAKGLRVIRSGLDGSELIVTHGLQRIFPGVTVDPTLETLKAASESGLPDDYRPVPPEKWLSRRSAPAPPGISSNIYQAGARTSARSIGGQ